MNQTNEPLPPAHLRPATKLELLISTLLRTGVISSMGMVALGTILSFVHHPDYFSSKPALQRLTQVDADFPHTLHAVGVGLLALRGQAFVVIGLILLIATPVLRVAVSAIAFAHQRDRKFTVITLIVLAMLLLSFFLGKAAGI